MTSPFISIDTNFLLYAIDQNSPTKQAQALHVLEMLLASGQATLSIQGLAEFVNASLKHLRPPLSPAAAFEQVAQLAQAYPILELTVPIVLAAARGVRDYKLSYYDAQVWATARLHLIPVVFSEDFAANTPLEGVRFVNPFAAEFDLSAWA